ncbi:hypothetical protein RhiirA5_429817 [Rhizophagus irregularis]|uniref:Ion transport domain-containing protein n=1 Tax=Rhizophagus irregularis TaxID=588596 RepID=A0A2N0NXS3_9GLOM|nr:hypothetical protein RhiirA5_429817 [Rhizophagus irregularis]
MTEDLELGDKDGDNITYLAISPDGSIVVTFNPYNFSITAKSETTSKEVPHNIKDKFDKKPSNIIGWSLAVSDIVDDKNNFLVAISCMTDKDMNPEGINQKDTNKKDTNKKEYISLLRSFINDKQIRLISPYYFLIILMILNINKYFYLMFIIIPIFILFFYEYYYTRNILVTDIKQFQLSRASGGGMINLFKFSFDNRNIEDFPPINHRGGVVTFLKNPKNSLKSSATLICMDYMRIQKIKIKLNSIRKRMQFGCHKNISVPKDETYLLPENLFEKLESIKDAKCIWKYLLKSKYQEFLMIDTSNHQKINIEIYDVSNLQLVNVFYRHRGEQCLNSNDNEPGIFAISTDSRLFAYSYANNIITLYLMESGLEIVSKRFDKIYEIKFLEFIEKDKKLFIIEKDEKHNIKFHIWIISGCLNDYFSISKNDIGLSDSNILNNEHLYYTLAKANGKVVFRNKDNEDRFKVVHEIITKITKGKTFGEDDTVIDEHNKHKYKSSDLEPWNNNDYYTNGRFLNNDRRFLLIIGQNSTQVWKSKSPYFIDFNDFHNFEDSNLVYILISDNIRSEAETKFLVEDDMTTVITHACKSLAYLYRNTNSIGSKKNQKFVSGIINIIKDFIKRYPDNWKLMEVQYPLMVYLIYSRSFPLMRHILFENAEKLHKPQRKYSSYPYYDNSELYKDLGLPVDSKDYNLKSANDLKLALKFCQDRDAVMLAYLLEYYSENSMSHIGWMINVTKILPDLSKLSNHDYYGNFMDSLLFKPCFGEMKYNFPIKRFQELSVCQNTLKVYVPVTALMSTNRSNILRYKKVRHEELHNFYMVPIPYFTTHNSKVEKVESSKKTYFSPFLQIKKNETFFNIPAMEAAINSRWTQAMTYWMIPLGFYVAFLVIFDIISQYYLNDNRYLLKNYAFIFVIFYYFGAYLLAIEIMQIKKYGIKYITLFNVFDIGSIICAIIVTTMILANSIIKKYSINIATISTEVIIGLISTTTLILWIEMLLLFRLFSVIAINIFIFGNIFKKIIPFFIFMIILIIGFGYTIYIFFAYSSINTEKDLTSTNHDKPPNTTWDAILSMYYLNTENLNDYSHYWLFKLLVFIANVVIVLVLLNMIIALMNDTFNKAKEDGSLGLMMYRTELIDDFERLDKPSFYNSPYICYLQDPNLMKRWIEKSQKLRESKLYSWFDESVDKNSVSKENRTYYDKVNFTSWYELISGSKNQNPFTTPKDHETLWF